MLTEEQKQLFIELNKELDDKYRYQELDVPQSFRFLSDMICPRIVGDEFVHIRDSTLLMMVTKKDVHTRNRLHEIFIGHAGTGKSEFLIQWNVQFGGIMVNGEHASKVGLVGSAQGKSITPGLLAQYTGHTVLLDEIDKMNGDDMTGLLQAMGEGRYAIAKGGMYKEFVAEVRCMGTANTSNKIIKPLLDRFDFKYRLTCPTRLKRAETIPGILKYFFEDHEGPESDIVKAYMTWIQDWHPHLHKPDKETIINYLRKYIKKTTTDIDKVSRRNLEVSIFRIAYSLAKLEKKDVNKNHIVHAILLKNKNINDFNPEGK